MDSFKVGAFVIYYCRVARVEGVTGSGCVLLNDAGQPINVPASVPLYPASAARVAGFRLALGLHHHDVSKFANPNVR